MSRINETLHPFLLRAEQAAEILNISKSFLYGLIKKRLIPVVRVGGRSVRIRREDLDEFILANVDKG